MNIFDKLKKLRQETGFSLTEIKKALTGADGNIGKAKELLSTWGKDLAGEKTERQAKQGIIDCYVHSFGKTGVLLDVRCESDFVAKSQDFKKLVHEICLQIAAMRPLFVSERDIPKESLDSQKNFHEEQLKDLDKPESIVRQIIDGKMKKYKESVSLLSQPWIKDDSKTIKNLIEEAVLKLGENVEVRRFTRYEI